MSASPEFYKPAQAPAFSPSCCATQPLVFGAGAGAGGGDDYSSCRTPTGSGISYLREATTCPPAPRKPPPPMCRKRLFQAAAAGAAADQQHQPCESPGVPLISLHLDELERLFRPHPPPTTTTTTADKRRRSGSGSGSVSRSGKKHGHHLDTELRSLN